jgi:hypothetical protein
LNPGAECPPFGQPVRDGHFGAAVQLDHLLGQSTSFTPIGADPAVLWMALAGARVLAGEGAHGIGLNWPEGRRSCYNAYGEGTCQLTTWVQPGSLV